MNRIKNVQSFWSFHHMNSIHHFSPCQYSARTTTIGIFNANIKSALIMKEIRNGHAIGSQYNDISRTARD